MKYKPLINVGALCLFMALQSCKKDTDNDTPTYFVPPTEDEFQYSRAQALANMKQHFQFDAQQGGTFTSQRGVTVYFPPNSLRNNGNEVFGQVEMEYIEIVDQGNMLVTGIGTQGLEINVPQNLVSGGAFFVRAYREGEYFDVHVPYKITVPASLSNGVDEDMLLYTGGYYQNGIGAGWQRMVDGLNYVEFGADYYKSTVNYFGWSSMAKVYADSGPKTVVKANVPTNCALGNAMVCIVFRGTKYFISNMEYSHSLADYHFIEHKEVPVGQTCHLIFFTAKGDDWAYIIHKNVVIEENHMETFDAKEIKSVNKNELIQLVNQLP